MATVEAMELAPAKSLRAIEDIGQLTVDSSGLFGDRDLVLVEGQPHTHELYQRGHVSEPGAFLSQREDPVLTSIVPKPGDGYLALEAKDHGTLLISGREDIPEHLTRVRVWGWEGFGVGQGTDAADWASDIVKRPVRLVAVSRDNPRFVENDRQLGRLGFADGYPMTIASVEGYDLLNDKLEALGYSTIPRNRTRTTLVLKGLELPEERDMPENLFPEDYIESIKIASDGLVLELVRRKACGRCSIPDTDQLTGARKGRPVLKALTQLGRHGYHANKAKYGDDPAVFFSQNFVLRLPKDMQPDQQIVISKGAEVNVNYTATTNWEPRS